MSHIILKSENISKQYRLGLVGTGTISHDLNRWWHKVRGKDDPFLKIGESNDRSTKAVSDYVWALKDINFEVKRGEVLGIIGKNGAGKSTLLKILSKVTSPTTGEIKTKGRIASLLEVGTGFHPEMTGRENIYLNGAILGMTKTEIRSKIDDIIDFSGCERYIDTPVKRYSSGMTVRLAFAVAAHLEPDILVVDEVLAVGDAEFQKKAIGKMKDISRGEGRTVLFVSHDMAAIKQLCSRVMVLENGKIAFSSTADDAIKYYITKSIDITKKVDLRNVKRSKGFGKQLMITDVVCNGNDTNKNSYGVTGEPFYFKVKVENKSALSYSNISITVSVYSFAGNFLFACRSDCIDKVYTIENTHNEFTCFLEKLPLNKGDYYIKVNCSNAGIMYDYIEDDITFSVIEGDYYGTGKLPAKKRNGVFIDYKWV